MNEMKNEAETAEVASTNERDSFEAWAKRYDLVSEPNYSEATKADCWAAWKARAALAAPPAAAPVDKSPELQGSVVDKTVNLQDAAAAPVVLPEPEAWIRKTDITELTDCEPETDGWTPLYSESALLATATGLPAQAVAYIDSEVLTSFSSSSNYRPADGWDCHIRHQENKRDTDVPLYSRPQAQADAQDDSALLDAMERQRIAVVPEYEGPWDAEIYNDEGEPIHAGSGSTPREAIRAAIAAAKGE